MTIQPSILIWSIICFCLLMLILNKMLFGPLLKVMDARQEKIARAQEKQEANELALTQAQAAIKAAEAEYAQQSAALMAEGVEEARKRAEAMVAEARIQSQKELEAYTASLQREAQEIKTKMDNHVDSLATVFANRLVS